MRKITLLAFLASLSLFAQQPAVSILPQQGISADKFEFHRREVDYLVTELASDKMEGRQIYTKGNQLASGFIEGQMAQIGLKPFGRLQGFRQEFQTRGGMANNVVGILPGKSKPEEIVIFSAHYDHIGKDEKAAGADKIYNGANDDASGVVAVLMLAKYFKAMDNNERTLLFVAFTGEEIGGLGSKYLSSQVNPENVVAMFNIEMIGTESKWGRKSAYITGYEMSTFGKILQENVKNSGFAFYPDPYQKQMLFYRSDNASLAKAGVPAHSISTSQMDSDAHYHQLTDEVSTLDLDNMTDIIRAIALGAQNIVIGKETPSRLR